MSKKKTIYLPLYDEFEDTPWISRNRNINREAYEGYLTGIEDLSQPDEQFYQQQVGKAQQAMWDDYNRNYQRAVNQNLARNYGRTGSTASTSGGYMTDSLQRQYNDSAARIAAQGHQMYNQLLNNLLQRTQFLGNAFNASGQTTQAADKFNYDIRQQNKDRQWQNDVLREKNKTDWIKIASDAGAAGFKGLTEGMKSGNPWVALGGAIGGTLSGGYASYADPSGQYGYMDDWNAIMDSGSSGGGIGNLGSMLGGSSGGSVQKAGKNLGSNVGSNAMENSAIKNAISQYIKSDARVKENIKKIGTKNGFNWYEFNYKKGLGLPEGRQEGVIAQEVEQIIPDAVIEIDGIKHVNYAKILGE